MDEILDRAKVVAMIVQSHVKHDSVQEAPHLHAQEDRERLRSRIAKAVARFPQVADGKLLASEVYLCARERWPQECASMPAPPGHAYGHGVLARFEVEARGFAEPLTPENCRQALLEMHARYLAIAKENIALKFELQKAQERVAEFESRKREISAARAIAGAIGGKTPKR